MWPSHMGRALCRHTLCNVLQQTSNPLFNASTLSYSFTLILPVKLGDAPRMSPGDHVQLFFGPKSFNKTVMQRQRYS